LPQPADRDRRTAARPPRRPGKPARRRAAPFRPAGRDHALQTGVAWLAASLTSVALAGLSRLLVTRISAGRVMALGMTLIGGGALWATQVPVDGHFWSALAGPFVGAGAGTAFGFIPISIAGL